MVIYMFMYVVGVVLSYWWYRDIARSWDNGHWLLMERIIVIALSLFSWAGIVACIILTLLTRSNLINLDKKVKW